MDTQLQRAKSIFERAIEFDAEARAGYVEGACADDAALRERVEGLLGEHDKQGDFLASRGVDQADNRRRPIPETVSHYRVFEKLGEGGMGEVWKAEDLNLKRTVALKFLPREVLGEEEIKARLIREAQAAASLDHPNVCAVYGIHEDDGRTFIAMACIDGPSLAEKIKERPLPLEEALEIAIQIAEGLQEAHERSVVHRDIKPSNVMLARRGRVKIMDFGLAAVADKTRLTKSGTTLGTPAYMSPEQAQGQAVDHRTDIWALGVVLYEMLTAKHPFPGEYEQAVVYSIINEAPEPVTAQRRGIPPKVDDLLNKALAKAPAARYQHADELIVDLRALSNNLAAATSSLDSHQVKTAPIPSGEVVSKRKLQLHQILLAATVLFALALSFLYLRQSSPQAPLRRFAISPPAALGFGASISADGKQVAFTTAGAEGELWFQDLNKQEPRMIEGTRGAGLTPSAPFWSPDSDFVGFSLGGQLMKVSAQGGLVIRLCELPGLLGGATWSPDGESIVFSSRDPYALYEVPSAGGVAKRIISPEERSSGGPWGVIVRPHFLPAEAGARVLVFSFGSPRENTMMALDLETGRREIVGSGNFPFYSSSGHLLFQPDYVTDEIWALPFSLKTLKATGDAFPISDTGRRPTVAADQTLTFVDRAADQRQLAWFDRDGMSTAFITQFPGEGAGTRNPALSPDGGLVAFSANQNSNLDIWIWDIMRGVKSRMTTDPADDFAPRWSPTGEEIAFYSNRKGNHDIFSVRTDGSSEPRALVATPQDERSPDWSRDGNQMLYERIDIETGVDLWLLERAGDSGEWESRPFLQTPFAETKATFSPDSRYVAYVSDESGQNEVYVRSFSDAGRKWTVSPSGGEQPQWSRDGKELFYIEGNTLVAASVSTAPTFSLKPAASTHSTIQLEAVEPGGSYDLSLDGWQILISAPVSGDAERQIRVVQNWYEEFRDREQE